MRVNSKVNGQYFDGMLDEVRVWDAALSAMAVTAEASHHHCTPLIAFWGFNGRQGKISPFERR